MTTFFKLSNGSASMITMSTLARITLAFMVGAGITLASTQSFAANIAAGKEKAGALCAACHGVDGVSVIDPSYPKLAGQYPDYLARVLVEYKNGTRKNAIMNGMAATLSAEDIANVSAFYASLPSPLKSKK
jgi:cytochrome c553